MISISSAILLIMVGALIFWFGILAGTKRSRVIVQQDPKTALIDIENAMMATFLGKLIELGKENPDATKAVDTKGSGEACSAKEAGSEALRTQ